MSSRMLARRPALLLALGLCAFGGVVTLLARLAAGPGAEPKRVALTSESGAQAYPAFSPDGREMAYSARGPAKDDVFHIFIRPVAGGTPAQVTHGDTPDTGPAWSPDGASLAFIRLREGRAQAMVVPARGGAESTVIALDAPASEAAAAPALGWTADGRALLVAAASGSEIPAIMLAPLAGGAPRAITHPPDGSHGDGSPALSPDGRTLAFVRNLDDDHADIYLASPDGGAPRQLTFDADAIHGIAWSAGGQDLIYSSNRGAGWRLWRVPAFGGSPRNIAAAGNRAGYPAIAPKGNRMAFTDSPALASLWLARLDSEDPRERQFLASAANETAPAWSPDGARIANVSELSGQPELWIEDARGGNRVQLTRLESATLRNPRWSPDGSTILVESRGPRGMDLYTVPAAGGKTVRVLGGATEGSWSRDGKSIYYSSGGQVWQAAADGSGARALTHRLGSNAPEESLDAKWVYYRSRRSIWRMPLGGGKEEEYFVPDRPMLYAPLTAAAGGLYFSDFEGGPRSLALAFLDFEEKKSRTALRTAGADFRDGYSISPDGRSALFAKTDRNQTNIVAIENFK